MWSSHIPMGLVPAEEQFTWTLLFIYLFSVRASRGQVLPKLKELVYSGANQHLHELKCDWIQK